MGQENYPKANRTCCEQPIMLVLKVLETCVTLKTPHVSCGQSEPRAPRPGFDFETL